MNIPAYFWLICATVAITVEVRGLTLALQRHRVVRQSEGFERGVRIAARSRVNLHGCLLTMAIAFELVGLVAVIPHATFSTELAITIGLFMFIAFLLALLTILLSVSEGGITFQRPKQGR